MLIGYARTFTEDQGFEAQVAALEAEGCEKLFRERVSSASERDQLEAALDWTREGDTLVVTTMDRLARSAQHLWRSWKAWSGRESPSVSSISRATRSTPTAARAGCS
jgi:DNA invertase Pin-like site-specific DNA recombinase